MRPGRVRAPAIDGAKLSIPDPHRVPEIARANQSWLATWNHDTQGRPASTLRLAARQHAHALARAYAAQFGLESPFLTPDWPVDQPLVMTGHQPELFHPGVWIKNFAAWEIARQLQGWSLNLIVDNDIPKSTCLLAPHVENSRVSLARVPFDQDSGEIPFEDWPAPDLNLFRTVPERLRATLGIDLGPWLLDEFWPRADARPDPTPVWRRFALARREIEHAMGPQNLETPLAQLAESPPFLWFLCHLLAHLPRFRAVHNHALAEYRTQHGIRSKNHPVAGLAQQGDWLESPFWVWRTTDPRRRPLLARQKSRLIELRIPEDNQILLELPLAPDMPACCAVERLSELPAQGVRIRPRALTTTMFCRYFLADLFIHGIGGAKYDELGDAIAQDFFGVEPPGFLTLSLTLWREGLPISSTSRQDLESANRRIRALSFHPDRFLTEPLPDSLLNIVLAKHQAIAAPTATAQQRKARWATIRRCNQALAPQVQPLIRQAETERDRILSDLASNRLARSREFSIVLHSPAKLRENLVGCMAPLDHV